MQPVTNRSCWRNPLPSDDSLHLLTTGASRPPPKNRAIPCVTDVHHDPVERSDWTCSNDIRAAASMSPAITLAR